MGQPKAALGFGESTILERIVAELHRIFSDIVVMAAPANAEAFAIEDLLRGSPAEVRLIRDQRAYQGAAVALARGLACMRHDIAFACSCDLPLLRAEVASALCAMLSGHDAVVPEIDGKLQPLCAAYRRRVRAQIEAQIVSGERRLSQIVDRLNLYRPGAAEMRRYDPELRSLLNVNTAEDYALVLAMRT